jgi:hypothetical protein
MNGMRNLWVKGTPHKWDRKMTACLNVSAMSAESGEPSGEP